MCSPFSDDAISVSDAGGASPPSVETKVSCGEEVVPGCRLNEVGSTSAVSLSSTPAVSAVSSSTPAVSAVSSSTPAVSAVSYSTPAVVLG
jgi:hypothetical protein